MFTCHVGVLQLVEQSALRPRRPHPINESQGGLLYQSARRRSASHQLGPMTSVAISTPLVGNADRGGGNNLEKANRWRINQSSNQVQNSCGLWSKRVAAVVL